MSDVTLLALTIVISAGCYWGALSALKRDKKWRIKDDEIETPLWRIKR